MTPQPEHLERLAGPVQEAAGVFTQLLLHFFNERLRAITFYGPAASGDYDVDWHRAQSVVVFDRIELEKLREFARHGPYLGQLGLVAPVIMTPDSIRDSLDSFPLELMEIQCHNVTILGADQFGELSFGDEHVRLQCERELKTLVYGLRQALLAAGGRESLLGEVERPAGETIARTLRGLLWLSGMPGIVRIEDLVEGTERLLQRPLPAIRDAVARERTLGWEIFARLHDELEFLREHVDAA